MTAEFEIIEEYLLLGQRRFRVRELGSGIVFNVSADSEEEAIVKARELYDKVRADRAVRLSGQG
ncbi:MAG: hypothetical protein F7B20_07705 [Aeropyrum sp.]|nr:hypothetical protein [Aeropyrum sp.]MCE4616384.1 hypothetical protein [Aeropyrum sp.]